ncbi:MAG: OmpA family protein [Bacteroidota bacterium]
MRLLFVLLFVGYVVSEATAQLLFTFDSVEVHRTDTIYFDFGEAKITKEADSVLRMVMADYQPGLQMYLEGHTDAVGSENANKKLGEKRAKAVGDYLRKSNASVTNATTRAPFVGWPEDDVIQRSFGERNLAINTRARERLNRRVLLRSGLPRTYARVRGRVTDSLDTPLAGLVVAHGRYMRDTTKADDEGYYEVNLPLEQVVGIDVFAPGYLFATRMLKIDTNRAIPPLNVSLAPVKPGAIVDIPDLFFVGNKAVLLERSKGSLSRIVTTLNFNPKMRVEIAGHVNQPGVVRGPGTWEWDLSEARAKMVYTYLIDSGIDEDRLVAKGYSNTEMRNPNPKNEREALPNRRVEIRVLE